jgi:hypothetical protein
MLKRGINFIFKKKVNSLDNQQSYRGAGEEQAPKGRCLLEPH